MKHSSEEFRVLAEHATILRCQVRSGAHGTAIDGQDDRDEIGICTEPPSYVIRLRRFEQYMWRTQPEGRRSGPGDLDLTIYSLRKWLSLALNGNPTVLLPLFVPAAEIVTISPLGAELRDLATVIVSRQAGHRFAGYLGAQRRGLLSRDGKGRDVTRPELIARYGWDTKYAGHMIRLGVQGCELLRTGRITLPVPEPWRTVIRQVRIGQRTMQDVLIMAQELESEIRHLMTSPACPLREYPGRNTADRWLVSAYQRAWAGEVQ